MTTCSDPLLCLIAACRAAPGPLPDADEIRDALAGRDPWLFLDAAFPSTPRPGGRCEICGGRFVIHNSKAGGGQTQTQYLKCRTCNRRVGKRAVAREYLPQVNPTPAPAEIAVH